MHPFDCHARARAAANLDALRDERVEHEGQRALRRVPVYQQRLEPVAHRHLADLRVAHERRRPDQALKAVGKEHPSC